MLIPKISRRKFMAGVVVSTAAVAVMPSVVISKPKQVACDDCKYWRPPEGRHLRCQQLMDEADGTTGVYPWIAAALESRRNNQKPNYDELHFCPQCQTEYRCPDRYTEQECGPSKSWSPYSARTMPCLPCLAALDAVNAAAWREAHHA